MPSTYRCGANSVRACVAPAVRTSSHCKLPIPSPHWSPPAWGVVRARVVNSTPLDRIHSPSVPVARRSRFESGALRARSQVNHLRGDASAYHGQRGVWVIAPIELRSEIAQAQLHWRVRPREHAAPGQICPTTRRCWAYWPKASAALSLTTLALVIDQFDQRRSAGAAAGDSCKRLGWASPQTFGVHAASPRRGRT